MKNNYDDAITSYKEALKLNSESAECHFNLASAYNDKGEAEKALFHFKESAEHDPGNAETYFNLGVLYERRGNYGEARSYYEKALNVNPDMEMAQQRLAKIEG